MMLPFNNRNRSRILTGARNSASCSTHDRKNTKLSGTPGAKGADIAIYKRLALALALAISLFIVATSYGERRLEERLPSDMRLCISIPNAQQFSEKWSASVLGDLFGKPEFAGFRNELRSASSSGVRPLLTTFDWMEVSQLATGPVVFALSGNGDGTIMAVTTNQRDAARGRIESLTNELKAKGAAVELIQLHGHDVFDVRVAAHRSQPSAKRLMTYADGVLYLTNDRPLLERMLSEQQSKLCLGQLDWFRAIDRQARADLPQGQVSWWVQGEALGWLVSQESVLEASGATASSLATLRTARSQGFDSIRAVGGSVAMLDRGQEAVAETYVFLDGPLQQAARMLTTINRALSTDTPWDRPEFSRVSRWNLDWPKAIGGYGSWFDATYGDGEEGVFEIVLDEIRDEPDSPRVDVREELFSQFVGPLTACEFSDESLGADVRVYAVPVRDEARVAKAMGQLLRGDTDVTKKTTQGIVVWHYGDLKRNPDEPLLGPDLSGWALCVFQNHFVLANDIRAIELLTTDADDEQTIQPSIIAMAKQWKNTDAICGWQHGRIPQALRPGYQSLRSGKAEETIVGRVVARMFRDAGAPGLNFQLLPKVSALDSVRGSAQSLIRNVDQGWRISTSIQLETQ